MNIRSIRLKHIKSFGDGPDGQGVRVSFEHGINRIAGSNGSGKSTLIEALGYAVFDCKPEAPGRMDLDTLLVRQGESSGEIEVVVENAEGPYTVRRGVGKKSKLRWTVQDASGFVTHETEEEVQRFLATLVGLDDVALLPNLFRKLVGVRQGGIITPFEQTPTEARKYFAPILDVDIYQRCYQELLAPSQHLTEVTHELEKKIARAQGIVENLADAPSQVAAIEASLKQALPALELRRKELAEANTTVTGWDKRERAVVEQERALAAARSQVEQTETLLATKKELLARAEQAQGVLEKNKSDYRAYVQAERTLEEIGRRRAEHDRLRERLADRRAKLEGAGVRSQEADKHARTLQTQNDERAKALAAREAELEARRKTFEQGGKEDDRAPDDATLADMTNAHGILQQWSVTLDHAAKEADKHSAFVSEANDKLRSFDPEIVMQATEAVQAAQSTHDQWRQVMTELTARRKARSEMVHSLEKDARCPLLNERCRQFDQGKLVLSEVQLDKEFDTCRASLDAAETALKAAQENLDDANKELQATEQLRVETSKALDDIADMARRTDEAAGRKAFSHLAYELTPPHATSPTLPESPRLPPPGEEPWEALAAGSTVAQRVADFAAQVRGAVVHWRKVLAEKKEARDERERRRSLESERLQHEATRLAESMEELNRRREEEQTARASSTEALAEMESIQATIKELTAKRDEFVALDDQAAEAETRKQAATDGYKLYAGAESEAKRLATARADAAMALSQLEDAKRAAQEADTLLERARKAYDPAAHKQAKSALPSAAAALSALERDIARDQEQLDQARRQAQSLAEAQKSLNEKSAQRAWRAAQSEVLKHGRAVLRDAGPKVAEHLVAAVNERAQRIYTALTPHDPGQLHWQPDYELRVATSSGVRRFAMLSGGQKVKAAVSLQLALVLQFSKAGICIFDEPTYALDADSRLLLAEAIVEAQRISQFEQLFIVTHDNAFDGHVDHTVLLSYAPATGSDAV